MKERVLTGMGIVAVLVPILIFSEYIVYPIAMGILARIGVWELLRVF